MQEIARDIFIEPSFIGVTLGALNFPHGLLLVDAPPRPEDARSWRASLINLGGGVDRMLVNLDAHIDRTLGARLLECTVVAHEKTAQAFRNRPTTFKSQDIATGADWELCAGLPTIRWAPPEITFTHRMQVHWTDNHPVILEHHPGPYNGACWVIEPVSKVVFVGDAVTPGQTPFLAHADLPVWIETLKLLLSPEYQEYLIVGGRTGLVAPAEVADQLAFLIMLNDKLDSLADFKASSEDIEALAPGLVKSLKGEFPESHLAQFTQRLKWGLPHYYARHYRAVTADEDDD
jgi:glyoxylase-like metal-dependent hydrolase (beta-lactamase superfamily II)